MECSAKLDYNVKKIFEKVASMIKLNEKEKEKNLQTSKMKINPSKLRKSSSDGGSCC